MVVRRVSGLPGWGADVLDVWPSDRACGRRGVAVGGHYTAWLQPPSGAFYARYLTSPGPSGKRELG